MDETYENGKKVQLRLESRKRVMSKFLMQKQEEVARMGRLSEVLTEDPRANKVRESGSSYHLGDAVVGILNEGNFTLNKFEGNRCVDTSYRISGEDAASWQNGVRALEDNDGKY